MSISKVTGLREGLISQSAICMLEFVTGWLSFDDFARPCIPGPMWKDVFYSTRQCEINKQYTSASDILLEVLIFYAERRLWLPKSESQH